MRAIIAIAAIAALAACSPPAEVPVEPEAPASLQSQVRRMAAQDQPVFAYTQLVTHLQTQGAVCTGPRGLDHCAAREIPIAEASPATP